MALEEVGVSCLARDDVLRPTLLGFSASHEGALLHAMGSSVTTAGH